MPPEKPNKKERRIHVDSYLDIGLPYSEIRQLTRASLSTIGRIKRQKKDAEAAATSRVDFD